MLGRPFFCPVVRTSRFGFQLQTSTDLGCVCVQRLTLAKQLQSRDWLLWERVDPVLLPVTVCESSMKDVKNDSRDGRRRTGKKCQQDIIQGWTQTQSVACVRAWWNPVAVMSVQ